MTEFGVFVFFGSNRIFAGCGKRAAAEVFAVENIGKEVKFSCICAAVLPFGGKCDYLFTTFFVVVKIAGDDILISPPFGT